MRYTFLAIITLLTLPLWGQATDFKVRYEAFLKGNIKIIGNNILNREERRKSANTPYNDRSGKAKLNDVLNMQYTDVDNDPQTFSSSSASFNNEGAEGGKVVYAGLYWAATYPYAAGQLKKDKNTITDNSRQDPSSVLLKTPSKNTYNPVQGTLIYDARNDEKLKSSSPYVYYADVTTLVAEGNSQGDYTVANVRATLGQIEGGSAAGWALVLVYENANSNVKKIITYDGFAAITNEESKTLTFSGFKTPEKGAFQTHIMGATLEGDLNMKDDNVLLSVPASGQYIALQSKLRPARNFFSSVIDNDGKIVSTRTPNSENTLGFDIFRLSIENDKQSLIPNNASSLDLIYSRSFDRYYLFLTALEIENNPKEVPQKVTEIETAKPIAMPSVEVNPTVKPAANTPRVKKLQATDTQRGYYVIVGSFLNINNVEKRVEEMKGFGYDAQVYYNSDQMLNFIYVAYYDNYQQAAQKVEEVRNRTDIPDPWILDVANND